MNLCDVYIEKIIEVRTYDNYVIAILDTDCWGCKRKGEKVYSDRVVFCTNYEYDNYIAKKISLHKVEWGSKIEIVIEPCEEEDTQEGRDERRNPIQVRR